uniref:Uncharacterized protein n=1 Tax=Arion vulgaris TaxID=1028688 RepID=A0A0B6Y0Y4_9EUPU
MNMHIYSARCSSLHIFHLIASGQDFIQRQQTLKIKFGLILSYFKKEMEERLAE